jgi:hypothetical protein
MAQCVHAEAMFDYSKHVRPVHQCNQSTAISIYDTSPESPDGKHICFIKYSEVVRDGHRGVPVMTDVMIQNRETGQTRKIYQASCNNHNGVNAIWINNSLIAFQVGMFKDFVLWDINTNKSVFGLIEGELGHKSFGNILYFSICNSRRLTIDDTRTPLVPEREGIHRLDCLTGEITRVVGKAELIEAFAAQNPTVPKTEAKILHVESNPANDKIMFDYRYPLPADKGWESIHGFVFANGIGIRWVKERPMHAVWFDDTDMFGVDTHDPEKNFYRYDLLGKKLEMLGGRSTHVGASPDRQWYIGESAFYEPEQDGFTRVYLYKRGRKEPYALLAEWQNAKITWTWVAHVNPSYSSDGDRAYFIRASDQEDKFEAVMINFAEIKH